MGAVLDASIALSWCLPDENSDAADRVFDSVSNTQLFVPAIFPYEIANALVSGRRSGRLNESAAMATAQLLGSLALSASTEGQDRPTVVDTALRHGLTAYDAAYLALAEAGGHALATLDGALRKAAKKAGVTLV